MADFDLSDPSESSSGTTFTSILNRLPTKRLDAKIAAAASAPMPEQGEQTGGYTAAYAHLSHLPLLPLYSEKQQKIRDKQRKYKDMNIRSMEQADPDNKGITGTQKAVFSVLANLSGGGGIMSVKRWERRMIGTNVMSANLMMEQRMLVVFTRWTVPHTQGTALFVDVLERRCVDPTRRLSRAGTIVRLKAGLTKDSKITLKVLGIDVKELKGQKQWEKAFESTCEAIAFVDDDGREVAMEMVARIQRACSPQEMVEIMKRFEKEWNVPVL